MNGAAVLAARGSNPSQRVASFFGEPADPHVALYRKATDDYTMYQHMGDGYYLAIGLDQEVEQGAATLHSMSTQLVVEFARVYEQNNAAVVTSGTWTTSSGSLASGGTYMRSGLLATGATATFTTPANTTEVGGRHWFLDAGLALVTINGDRTAATELSTAQQLVDAGTFPNTILVANGGTLNPTDRVIDMYSASAVFTTVWYAHSLAPGVHSVVLTHTGYKRAASASDRLYVDAFYVVRGGMVLADLVAEGATLTTVTKLSIRALASVSEYVFKPVPNGAVTNEWVGNGHGYEYEASLTIDLDGETPTLAVGEYAIGDLLTITRVADMRHAEDTTTPIADTTLVYQMRPDFFMLDATIEWLMTGRSDQSYITMWTIDTAVFDRAGAPDNPDATNLGNDDYTRVINTNTDALWYWQAAGEYAAFLQILNLSEASNDYQYANTDNRLWIDDTGSSDARDKVYFNRGDDAGNEPIAPGDVWRCVSRRSVRRFADPNALLAKS